MRSLLVIALALVLAVPATRAVAQPAPRAEPVQDSIALLPLDADAKLELYGQPVAKELSRALVQGGLKVVVVGAKMAVPEEARIVVDGTIKAKGNEVTLSIRVRDSRDGAVLDTLNAIAPSFTAIDHASEELSAKVVPSVKGRLATLLEQDKAAAQPKPIEDPKHATRPAPPKLVLLAAVTASHERGALRDALAAELAPWAGRRHHEPRTVEAQTLAGKLAPVAVADQKADLAISLDVVDFVVVPADAAARVPLATARVRVRIADAQAVVFDRVIVTSTVVGDPDLPEPQLAARVARAVLDIADPHLKRRIPTWY